MSISERLVSVETKTTVGFSAFPEEIYTAPESWVREAYPNLIHYKRLAKGGHFAAWEQPEEFVSEMRESFRSVR